MNEKIHVISEMQIWNTYCTGIRTLPVSIPPSRWGSSPEAVFGDAEQWRDAVVCTSPHCRRWSSQKKPQMKKKNSVSWPFTIFVVWHWHDALMRSCIFYRFPLDHKDAECWSWKVGSHMTRRVYNLSST